MRRCGKSFSWSLMRIELRQLKPKICSGVSKLTVERRVLRRSLSESSFPVSESRR
ncbi:MAG: hypothetical protein U0164_08280 [Gemmatimonadaceae bacterium]